MVVCITGSCIFFLVGGFLTTGVMMDLFGCVFLLTGGLFCCATWHVRESWRLTSGSEWLFLRYGRVSHIGPEEICWYQFKIDLSIPYTTTGMRRDRCAAALSDIRFSSHAEAVLPCGILNNAVHRFKKHIP